MQIADLRRYAASAVRAVKLLFLVLYLGGGAILVGWGAIEFASDVAHDGPAWRALKAKVSRAIDWVEGGPPSFQECQDAANVWRKYGRATLSDRRAQRCQEEYGLMVR